MNWHILIKVVTGIIVVPLAISARALWPWWVKASMPVKILSGIVVLPYVALAAVLSPWWNEF